MRARLLSRLLLTAVLLAPMPLLAQLRYQAGQHYHNVPIAQASGLAPAGRIEVTEVFSYLCSGCNRAQRLAEEIKANLPADAAMTYVHAGFNQGWQMIQRVHVTAQLLGVADKNHARVFQGIWETGDFRFFDLATGKSVNPAPTIADAARFYAKGGGVTEAAFAQKAASPEADAAVKRIESLVRGWAVGATPTFVVAGRYRVEVGSVKTIEELHALFAYLIGQERARLKAAAAGKN